MWWGFARKRVIFRFHQSTIFWVVRWPSQITTWAPLPHASQHPKLHTPSNVWASVGAWKGSKKKDYMLARFRLEELFEKKHQMTTEYSSIKIVTVRRFENILQRSPLPLPLMFLYLGIWESPLNSVSKSSKNPTLIRLHWNSWLSCGPSKVTRWRGGSSTAWPSDFPAWSTFSTISEPEHGMLQQNSKLKHDCVCIYIYTYIHTYCDL